MSEYGFVLYAQPSFLEGMSRLIDFTGSLNTYNISLSPEEADFRAILSDWEAVGSGILLAEKDFIKENEPVINHEQPRRKPKHPPSKHINDKALAINPPAPSSTNGGALQAFSISRQFSGPIPPPEIINKI